MAKTHSALTLGFAIAAATAAMFACSDDAGDKLGARSGVRGGATGDGGFDPNDPNDPNNPANQIPDEEQKFIAIQPDLDKKCGNTCHNQGTYRPEPPTFLAGATPPDVYKTIKAHPGIVTRDVYQSLLLTKGPHAGPALNADPEFEKKVVEWLEAESLAIQSLALPSTPPATITQGPNEIVLDSASGGKLTGSKLKFEASLLGGMLSLTKIVVTAPAGTDVHILQPRFIRVLAQPKADGTKEVPDPADSFSNTDQTLPQGVDTQLGQGSVIFSGDGWRPYDLAADKIRIEAVKLEPGKVQVIQAAPTCKNVANFVANVLPIMRGGASLNCANCHGNGLAGLYLTSNTVTDADRCNEVLSKMSAPPNVAKSLIITKVTDPAIGHSGGKVADTAGWTNAFVNNSAVFF